MLTKHLSISNSSPSAPEERLLGSRTFSLQDQVRFATWSGDYNPLHVDPVYARRSIAGGPAVHGMHIVLWALEVALEQGIAIGVPVDLHAEFLRPTLIQVPVQCWLIPVGDAGIVYLSIKTGEGNELARIKLHPGITASAAADAEIMDSEAYAEGIPVRWDWDDLRQINGDCDLRCAGQLHTRYWPHVCNACGVDFAVLLGSTSRLVGMECPGLNSLYSELHLGHSEGACVPRGVLRYATTKTDFRFKFVDITIGTFAHVGKIRAFIRPELLAPVTMDSIIDRAPDVVFRGERALVIGGSRGIGEVTAKLCAATGAEVCLTYSVGREDAERVLADIRSGGFHATIAQLDVMADDRECEVLIASFKPTHLFYCATPFIFAGQRERFSDQLLERFRGYYVSGFERVLRIAYEYGLRYAWYPSSVALEENPGDMREYCIAKLEGEALIHSLAQELPDLAISCPRLPRTATDQTNGIVAFENADPVSVILAHLP